MTEGLFEILSTIHFCMLTTLCMGITVTAWDQLFQAFRKSTPVPWRIFVGAIALGTTVFGIEVVCETIHLANPSCLYGLQ